MNNDVLFRILDYLDLFDKIAMRKACGRLQSVVDEYSARKTKSVCIDHTLEKRFKDIVKHFGHNLDSLHLISTNNLNRVDKLKKEFQLINKHCTKVSKLQIETKKFYAAMPLSISVLQKSHFQHLIHLEMRNIKFERDLSASCAAAFENVEVLKFESVANFSGRLLTQLRRLKVLQLTSCAQLKPNHLYDFFKTKPALREIEVIRCREIDEILINEMINNLPSIEKISVTFSFAASIDPSCLRSLSELRSLSLHNFRTYDVNKFIKQMAMGSTRLQQWEINGENIKMFQLDEETVEHLEKCKHLEALSFHKCNFVNDELLSRLAKALDIHRFELRDCWGFGTNGLMKLVEFSPNLSFMAIKNCTIPRTATIEIANVVARENMLKIDYDIDCGFRPYEDVDWPFEDDDDMYEYDWYCDSNSSDGE